MKRISVVFSVFFLMNLLVACTSTDPNKNSSTPNNASQDTTTNNETESNSLKGEPTNSSNEQEEMKSQMEKLDFSEIEIEISYGNNQEYEAEIEQDKNQPIEAKVEGELNNKFLRGKEAFDSIYSKAKKLTLTKDSSDQETIKQVLQAFDLGNDYNKFEIEITFNGGSKLDVEDRKGV